MFRLFVTGVPSWSADPLDVWTSVCGVLKWVDVHLGRPAAIFRVTLHSIPSSPTVSQTKSLDFHLSPDSFTQPDTHKDTEVFGVTCRIHVTDLLQVRVREGVLQETRSSLCRDVSLNSGGNVRGDCPRYSGLFVHMSFLFSYIIFSFLS